jgi:hypothetical protein
MGILYSDQYQTLKELLASAGKHEDATLLIPDLQRPSSIRRDLEDLTRGIKWRIDTQ